MNQPNPDHAVDRPGSALPASSGFPAAPLPRAASAMSTACGSAAKGRSVPSLLRAAAPAALALLLGACQANDNLFTGPTLTPVGVGLTVERAPVPASFVPAGPTSYGSLFGTRSRDLLVDRRATEIGDTLTVDIRFDDLANFSNETDRERATEIAFDIFGFLEGTGFGGNGGSADGAAGFGIGSDSEFDGEGEIDRRERLRLRLAAVVTDQLPNGNLFISGTQEIKVTNEVRVLKIAGIVDPLDVTADNSVPFTDVAEARITYTGRGRISDVQRPPYGQLIYDTVWPY